MEQGALFPMFYLPNVDYFNKLVGYQQNVLFEMHEHFPKQTFRNRVSIHTPQGRLDLIIPINKGNKVHRPIRDVRISYDFDWQRLHWRSLQTAYRSAVFFEFYEDDFVPFYEKKWPFLFDYTNDLLHLLLKLLKVNITYRCTQTYEKSYKNFLDFRENMPPKQAALVSTRPYFQVFETKNGFLENLSVVDLLFNQGPQSMRFLHTSS